MKISSNCEKKVMEDIKDEKFLLEQTEDSSHFFDTQMQSQRSPPDNSFKNFKQGSLVALTQKFLTLIHEGRGLVDLNYVSKKFFKFPSMFGAKVQFFAHPFSRLLML